MFAEPKRNEMNTFEKYQTEKIEELFIKMVKIEMELTGKSFKECKVIVKDYLKSIGLI